MERNITLDYFKIFLCILVITIHTEPLFHMESLGGWFISNGLARIAVPSFFIINGYYIYSKITSGTAMIKWLKRMFVIFITWSLIYLPILRYDANLTVIISLITGIYHLWYLPALIGGAIMLILLKKFIKNDTVLLITAILLFFVGYYIQDYYFPISNSRYRIILYRNFIFLGFPFIFIGYYIKKYKERLLKIPTSILATIVVISIVVLLLESNFYFIHNSRKDFLISILFLAPSLFVLISKISRYAVNDGYIGSLASGIFYTHILSIYIVNSVFPASELKILLLPFIIFLSMILSAVIIRLNKQINIFF